MIEAIITTVTILLIAIWNGYVIQWAHAGGADREKYSKIWHSLGLVIRGLIIAMLIVGLYPDIKEMLKAVLLLIPATHFIYNSIINIITGKNWYYISNSGLDKFFAKHQVYPLVVLGEIMMVIVALAI